MITSSLWDINTVINGTTFPNTVEQSKKKKVNAIKIACLLANIFCFQVTSDRWVLPIDGYYPSVAGDLQPKYRPGEVPHETLVPYTGPYVNIS